MPDAYGPRWENGIRAMRKPPMVHDERVPKGWWSRAHVTPVALPCLAPRGACVHPIRRCRRIVCMIDHDGLILALQEQPLARHSIDRFPSFDHASFSPDSLIPSSDPAARSDEDRLRSPCCQAWRSSNRPMHRPVARPVQSSMSMSRRRSCSRAFAFGRRCWSHSRACW